MEWTKIPTDLLQSRKSDKEIIAITKYQLLWAMLERKPEDDVALRYMTSKQLQQANDFMTVIERCVNADIKSVENTRKRQKVFYDKNQTLTDDSNGRTNANTNGMSNHKTNDTDKIREDKIRLDKENTKEKPKSKEYSQDVLDVVNRLKSILVSKYDRNYNTSSWNKDVDLMIRVDLLSKERILKALDWYEKNIDDKYTPVIQSGSSLREKFNKLENAIAREKAEEDRPF